MTTMNDDLFCVRRRIESLLKTLNDSCYLGFRIEEVAPPMVSSLYDKANDFTRALQPHNDDDAIIATARLVRLFFRVLVEYLLLGAFFSARVYLVTMMSMTQKLYVMCFTRIFVVGFVGGVRHHHHQSSISSIVICPQHK